MDKRIIILIFLAAWCAPAMAARFAVLRSDGSLGGDGMLGHDTASKPTVYDTVALELRVIDYADQRWRLQMEDTSRKYGFNSKQVKGL